MIELHARMLEQSERLTAQLAISQLPRVEQRLIGMMWLLADTWGRVTPDGVRLDLPLSHEILGELVGARRPTVTLALRKLAQLELVIKQGTGWLILDQPEWPVEAQPVIEAALARLRSHPEPQSA